MRRDKNGRFMKTRSLQIPIPSIFSIIKALIFLIIFLPWCYIILFRFDIPKILEIIFAYLLGIGNRNQCEKADKTPY